MRSLCKFIKFRFKRISKRKRIWIEDDPASDRSHESRRPVLKWTVLSRTRQLFASKPTSIHEDLLKFMKHVHDYYFFYVGSRDKLLLTIIILTNFTTIKKLFWNKSPTESSPNQTSKTSSKPFSAHGSKTRSLPDQILRHFKGAPVCGSLPKQALLQYMIKIQDLSRSIWSQSKFKM